MLPSALSKIPIFGYNASYRFSFERRMHNLFVTWLNKIFNSVDKERLKKVGPNCACAEWLLRNGATVHLKGMELPISDYNELLALEEVENPHSFVLNEIYAKDAAVSSYGFIHLKNCEEVKKISFISCIYLDDLALQQLHYVSNSLLRLEVKSCYYVTDEGLRSLISLRKLKNMLLADLKGVKNGKKCEEVLRKELPQCKIDFTF